MGSGSEDVSSSSQESATLGVGLLYLWSGAMLLAAGLGFDSDFESLSVAATGVAVGVILVSTVASGLKGVAALEIADFSVVMGAGVGVLLVSFAVAAVLVSTALLAWACFLYGGV